MKHYLGIDIGGTAVKLGIVDETGTVLAKTEESVSFDGYRTPILTTVLKAAQAFLAAQSVPAESLAGIGVSATGQIDSRKGIVAGTCGNLPNYNQAVDLSIDGSILLALVGDDSLNGLLLLLQSVYHLLLLGLLAFKSSFLLLALI